MFGLIRSPRFDSWRWKDFIRSSLRQGMKIYAAIYEAGSSIGRAINLLRCITSLTAIFFICCLFKSDPASTVRRLQQIIQFERNTKATYWVVLVDGYHAAGMEAAHSNITKIVCKTVALLFDSEAPTKSIF